MSGVGSVRAAVDTCVKAQIIFIFTYLYYSISLCPFEELFFCPLRS